MNFRRSNISYIGGVAASRFSDIPYSAPSASKPPLRMKKLLGEKTELSQSVGETADGIREKEE